MLAEIDARVLPRVDVTAPLAEARPRHEVVDSGGRHDAAAHTVLAALVVDDVVRTKLRQAKKAGSIERLRLSTCSDQCPQGKAGEVVSRQESLSREVAVGVEVRFR